MTPGIIDQGKPPLGYGAGGKICGYSTIQSSWFDFGQSLRFLLVTVPAQEDPNLTSTDGLRGCRRAKTASCKTLSLSHTIGESIQSFCLYAGSPLVHLL